VEQLAKKIASIGAEVRQLQVSGNNAFAIITELRQGLTQVSALQARVLSIEERSSPTPQPAAQPQESPQLTELRASIDRIGDELNALKQSQGATLSADVQRQLDEVKSALADLRQLLERPAAGTAAPRPESPGFLALGNPQWSTNISYSSGNFRDDPKATKLAWPKQPVRVGFQVVANIDGRRVPLSGAPIVIHQIARNKHGGSDLENKFQVVTNHNGVFEFEASQHHADIGRNKKDPYETEYILEFVGNDALQRSTHRFVVF
jgi:hypothetical protein